MEHHYIDVSGIRTHYIAAGQGPPVVLLHGLGASVITWSETIEPLAQSFAVYALDIAGHGDSEKPDIAYTAEAGVHYLLSFLDALGLPQASVVGNSMGGFLALKAALEHPDRISRLALVDAAGLGRELALFLRVASLPLLGELMHWPRFVDTRTIVRQVFAHPGYASSALVQEVYRTRSSSGAHRAELSALRDGVDLGGFRRRNILLERLPELRPPLLLVWGAQDRIIPVAHAYAAAQRLPSARLVVYQRCGHWPQIEMALEFNQELTAFLAQG